MTMDDPDRRALCAALWNRLHPDKPVDATWKENWKHDYENVYHFANSDTRTYVVAPDYTNPKALPDLLAAARERGWVWEATAGMRPVQPDVADYYRVVIWNQRRHPIGSAKADDFVVAIVRALLAALAAGEGSRYG